MSLRRVEENESERVDLKEGISCHLCFSFLACLELCEELVLSSDVFDCIKATAILIMPFYILNEPFKYKFQTCMTLFLSSFGLTMPLSYSNLLFAKIAI